MTTTVGSHLLKSRPVTGLLGLSLLSLGLGLVLGGCVGDDSGTGETETETGNTTDNPTTTGASATESGSNATENGSGTETETETETETSESETSALEVSYAADIQPIWSMSCVLGCHAEGGANPQLLLGEGVSYGNIVDVMSIQVPSLMLVEPGDTNTSYLWHKISNTHLEVGGSGTRMPLTPLSEDRMAQIKAWIDGGAQDN